MWSQNLFFISCCHISLIMFKHAIMITISNKEFPSFIEKKQGLQIIRFSPILMHQLKNKAQFTNMYIIDYISGPNLLKCIDSNINLPELKQKYNWVHAIMLICFILYNKRMDVHATARINEIFLFIKFHKPKILKKWLAH